MNMALVMTAVHQGTVAANHTEVIALHKDANGKLNGARLKDNISGEEFDVKAKVSKFQTFPSLVNVSLTETLLCLSTGHHQRHRTFRRRCQKAR